MEIISLPLGILAFIALAVLAVMLIVGGVAYAASTGEAASIAWGIFFTSLGALIGSVLAIMLWELKQAPDDERNPGSRG